MKYTIGCITTILVALPALVGCASSNRLIHLDRIVYDLERNEPVGGIPGCIENGDLLEVELRNVNPFVYDITVNAQTTSLFLSGADVFQRTVGVAMSGTENTKVMPFSTEDFRSAGAVESESVRRGIATAIAKQNDVEIAHDQFIRRHDNAVGHLLSLDGVVGSANAHLSKAFTSRNAVVEKLSELLGSAFGALGSSSAGLRSIAETDEREARNAFRAYDNLVRSLLEYLDIVRSQLGAGADAASRVQWKLLDTKAGEYRRQRDDAEAMLKKYLDAKPAERFAKLGEVYDRVVAADFAVRASVQAENDYVTISFKGTPRAVTPLGVPIGASPMPERKIRIPVCGGFKIDFSGGLVFSDLVGDTYTLRDTNYISVTGGPGGATFDTVPGKLLLHNERDLATYGPGALMHVYWKGFPTADWALPDISFGAFTNNFTDVTYVFGLGTSFTALDSRFTISGGASFGKVARLATGLRENTVVRASDVGTANPSVTQERMGHGWFVAFTWNLP